MAKKKFKISNAIFIVLILLLLIPVTRSKIQLWIHQAKVSVFSPSAFAKADQPKIQSFDYAVASLDGLQREAPVGKGKVTFISYWATWCPPCIAELPSLQALYSDYGNKVDFLFITNEDSEIVENFLKRRSLSIPAVNSLMETPSALYESTIPTNYIIDKTGNIIVKEQGAVNWNTASTRTLLDKLLME